MPTKFTLWAETTGVLFHVYAVCQFKKYSLKDQFVTKARTEEVKVEHFPSFYFVLFLISHIEVFICLVICFICLFEDIMGRVRDLTERGWMYISLLDICGVRTHVTMSVLGMIHTHFGMKQQMH